MAINKDSELDVTFDDPTPQWLEDRVLYAESVLPQLEGNALSAFVKRTQKALVSDGSVHNVFLRLLNLRRMTPPGTEPDLETIQELTPFLFPDAAAPFFPREIRQLM